MNTRGVVALVAVASVMAGCTSRTGGESADPTETKESTSAAVELDEMLTEAEAAAETLNTVDATDIEGSLDEWESVATGDLLTDFQQDRADSVESLTTAATSSEGESLAAAATEFDSENGVTEVLVAMKVSITRPGAEPTETQQRLRIGMTRTDDGWKIDSVETIPYGG